MRHQGQSLAQHVPSVDVGAALGPEGPSEMGRRGGERAAEPWKRGSEDNQDRAHAHHPKAEIERELFLSLVLI